jgi:hypothetical protein
MSNEHFINTRQYQVATVPTCSFVSGQISFQNPVQRLGGDFSNTTPA